MRRSRRFWSAPAERSGDGALGSGEAEGSSSVAASECLRGDRNKGAPRLGRAVSPLRSATALHILVVRARSCVIVVRAFPESGSGQRRRAVSFLLGLFNGATVTVGKTSVLSATANPYPARCFPSTFLWSRTCKDNS